MRQLAAATSWQPDGRFRAIRTVDAHTEGEPFRVVVDGIPEIPGETILAKRRWAEEHLDEVRRQLMWEPRGHADMYGGFVVDPVNKDADLGVLFVHNEGFSTMCGHGIIALTKVAIETGMIAAEEPETRVIIEAPAGRITAFARVEGGRVRRVRFLNVPSFVAEADASVEVPGLGRVRYDLAFGGAFYAYVEVDSLNPLLAPAPPLTLGSEDFRRLIEIGMKIKRAVMAEREVVHPYEPDLSFLYGVIFVGSPEVPEHHSRNVCVFANGEVDRCPTGTGVSGRLAIHHARGDLSTAEESEEAIVIESILGSHFSGRVVETVDFGPHAAIIPEVSGTAHLTGRHEFLIDPDDPLADGFLLR